MPVPDAVGVREARGEREADPVELQLGLAESETDPETELDAVLLAVSELDCDADAEGSGLSLAEELATAELVAVPVSASVPVGAVDALVVLEVIPVAVVVRLADKLLDAVSRAVHVGEELADFEFVAVAEPERVSTTLRVSDGDAVAVRLFRILGVPVGEALALRLVRGLPLGVFVRAADAVAVVEGLEVSVGAAGDDEPVTVLVTDALAVVDLDGRRDGLGVHVAAKERETDADAVPVLLGAAVPDAVAEPVGV